MIERRNNPELQSLSDSLRQELAANTAAVLSLSTELSASRVETAVRVEGLRAEQRQERRLRVVALAGGGFALFWASAENSEYCSPGARITDAINAQLAGEKNQAKLTHLYNHPLHQSTCDVVFPLRSHSVEHWPTTQNVVGFAVLGIVAAAVALYHRAATIRDFHRVEHAARMERSDDRA